MESLVALLSSGKLLTTAGGFIGYLVWKNYRLEQDAKEERNAQREMWKYHQEREERNQDALNKLHQALLVIQERLK